MKKLAGLLFIAFAVLFSACGTSNFSVMKRQYRPGYHVDFGREKVETVSLNKESSPEVKNESLLSVTSDISTPNDVVASPASEAESVINLSTVRTEINSQEISNVSNLSAAAAAGDSKAQLSSSVQSKKNGVFKRYIASKIEKKVKKQSASGLDAETILLLVLSLFPFFALLAVYLKDGSITTNFWVDLLLHFTIIGYAIFAILVVLDIVNLG